MIRSRCDSVGGGGGGVVAEIFRDLHKLTRFSGGGGVVADFFRDLQLRNHIYIRG